MNKDDLLFIIMEIIATLIALIFQLWILKLLDLYNNLMIGTIIIMDIVIAIIFFILYKTDSLIYIWGD